MTTTGPSIGYDANRQEFTVKLRSIDIPQADSLARIREVVAAVARYDNPTVKLLSEKTGVHERHVRYRLDAARALGLLVAKEKGTAIAAKGVRLLTTAIGSEDERQAFKRAVSSCPAVRVIAPDLLTISVVDLDDLTARIVRLSDLSPATANRRAVALRAWHRDLVK